MRAYYEDLWDRLPDALEPLDLGARRAFLRAHLAPGDRVVDLGCGAGYFTAAAAAAAGEPVGIDIAEGALRRARAAHPELDFARVPEEGPLPLEDAAWDLVWCSEVLEHVADTGAFLSEVRRILRPGGRLLVTTPYHGRLKDAARALARPGGLADPLGDHLRFYTRRSLRWTLAEFGFDHIAVSTAGGPPLLRRTLRAVAVRGSFARRT